MRLCFHRIFQELKMNSKTISQNRFLIIGGSGSIGNAVAREIFKRDPKALHVVDISENTLVELVREIRSTIGYGSGEFKTFALDCGSMEFIACVKEEGPYDYVFNLSALKHVRSEKDPYTLMRMIKVNIFNTIKSLQLAKDMGAKNYFCVSTDKAANPVNMMGASKRIMEMFLMRESLTQKYFYGSLCKCSFFRRFSFTWLQPTCFKTPTSICTKRYSPLFHDSTGIRELCLLSGLFGKNREIFFPKLSEKLHLITFSEIAIRFLKQLGYQAYKCASEDEARNRTEELINKKQWPCYFFKSDTTGEKDFEEFFTNDEELDMDRFDTVGVIKNQPNFDKTKLENFIKSVNKLQDKSTWTKGDIIKLFYGLLPHFAHKETGKNLDQRM